MGERRIDWSEIHRRLEGVRTALDRGWTPDPEEKRRILRARAQMLAREPQAARDGEALEVVTFLLAGECYGVESHYVREVYPLKDYTPLPSTPPFVLGLVNVRGQILSVVDLKKFFGMPEVGISDLNKIIILRDAAMELGILADAILGVRSIPLDDIQPPLPTLTGVRETFLKGVTSKQLVVLHAGKILANTHMIVHQEA